jgi:signal peptidase I
MVKKIICNCINAISIFIIICAVVVLLTVLFTESGEAPSLFGYSLFRVTTGSMEPTIRTNEAIIVKQTDVASLEVGDIISFYSKDPSLNGEVNTHRIVEIEKDDDHYYFTTKGDANNSNDLYTTTEEDIVGRLVTHSVGLGKAVRLASNPLIFIPFIVVPLALMLIINLWHTISLAKKIARDEEEQEVREAVKKMKEQK